LHLPYYTISDYLKGKFGCKVVKLSLDAGFTCPNRDGSKGTGGCIFCSASGSGDMASDIPGQIKLLSKKWATQKYIAYFQSYTNTYAPVSELRKKFYSALEYPGVTGLAIATRPDCFNEDILSLLDELHAKTLLWVELGLQTIHDETAAIMNRCYPFSDFDNAIKNLSKHNIKTVVHLIFGLPGETKEQMLDSVKQVCSYNPFGIKIHLLNVIKGSAMESLYPEYIPFTSIDEYVNLVADALEIIPPGITVHRLTADAPRNLLMAPEWSYRKRTILNNIFKEMKARKRDQGRHLSSPPQSDPSLPSL
jgi:radical SAM protein (TIGR01212 family)